MANRYIHYGSDNFNLEEFNPVENMLFFTKPHGGLWASPIDAKQGWKQFCEAEEIFQENLEKSFTFKLKPGTRLLFIDDVKQLKELPSRPSWEVKSWKCLDFEKLSQEYDAIEITLSEEKTKTSDKFWDGLYNKLYGWDCDSILIMNPECIEIIED